MDRKESNLSFKNIFKRETKLASYIIICLTVVVLSLSYAMFFQVDSNSKNQVVEAGTLRFTYTNGTEISSGASGKGICFEPMSLDEAELYASECSYQFSVQNTGTLKASYTLKLISNGKTNSIDPSKLKVILKRKLNGESTFQTVTSYPKLVSSITNDIMLEDEMDEKSTIVYSVQLYIDDSLTDASGNPLVTSSDNSKTVSYKIEGVGLVHEDQELNTETPTP